MSSKKVEKTARRCDICEKTIVGSTYKYNAHKFQHRAVAARYSCSFCPREFFRSDAYKTHVRTHTGEPSKNSCTCDHCGRTFADKRNLIIHLKIHDDSLDVSYRCVACGASYCEERLLKYHIRKSHYNLQGEEPVHTKKEVNETWIEPLKESQICVEITKINNNTIAIKRCATVKKEIKEEKIELAVKEDPADMDEKSKFKKYLSSTFAENDKSQYSKAKCDYCHKDMLKKSLLSHIRERHLKLKRFHCDNCGRYFARHYQLVDHVCGKTRRRRVVGLKTEKS